MTSASAAPGALRPATSDDFRRQPLGRLVRGRSFVVWCLDPTLCGATYWGRPSEGDARALVEQLLVFDAHPALRAPFDVLTDARHVEGIDGAALQVLVQHLRGKLAIYGERVGRHAIVHPGGVSVVGAALAGLYRLLVPRHAWAPFARVADALAWLGRPDVEGLVDDLARERLADGGSAALVERLRALLAGEPGAMTLGDAARRLGLGPRSLQRALQDEGATFREARASARLARAREVLSVGGKLDGIARDSGYASGSGLRAALRRAAQKGRGRSPRS